MQESSRQQATDQAGALHGILAPDLDISSPYIAELSKELHLPPCTHSAVYKTPENAIAAEAFSRGQLEHSILPVIWAAEITISHKTKPYILKLFFSNRYSYAQILRSTDGNILAAASTIEKDLRESLPSTSDKEASKVVGKLLAERAKAAGIEAVHWDRKQGQKFHGKIKELLQTMQAEGLPLN